MAPPRRLFVARAVAALVAVGGAAHAVGCDDWKLTSATPLPSTPMDPCCGLANPYFYECEVMLDTTGCDPISTACPSTECPRDKECEAWVRQCFASDADAVKQARAFAQSAHKWATVDWCATPVCKRVACGRPLDHTVCADPDAGPSCSGDAMACSQDADCCSGICSESGACEPCRADGEGCSRSGECCSGTCNVVNTCQAGGA